MLQRAKNLNSPGQYVLFKIDHVDITIKDKIVALQDAIESIEPGTNVELDIKLTFISERRDTYHF